MLRLRRELWADFAGPLFRHWSRILKTFLRNRCLTLLVRAVRDGQLCSRDHVSRPLSSTATAKKGQVDGF